MNSIIEPKIGSYPESVKVRFREIRSLVLRLAKENGLGEVEETLKWGQLSYLCKSGSTIRIDWRIDYPESIDLLFNCKTTLVETFREIFQDSIGYRGNRVVIIPLNKPIPREIETCVLMALNYHKLKKLPLLGA